MSQFTDELQAFVERLAKDGYPTAVAERAVIRMEALENEIVRLNEELSIECTCVRSNN